MIGLGLSLWRRGGGFTASGNKMLIIGDSIAHQHAYVLGAGTAPTAITLYGTDVMRITKSGHGMVVGSGVYGFRATDEDLNGPFTVTTVVDANNFEVTLPSVKSGTVVAKTGGWAYSRQHLLDDRGSINWLTSLNGACFDIVGVHAEGASQTDYLSTLISKASGTAYDWVTVISGINDAAADVAGTTIAANIIAACNTLRAAGKGVILSTIGPWGSAHTSYTAGRYTEVKAANALLRAYAASDAGVFLMDAFAAGSDGNPDGAGVPASNMLVDYLHPTQKGAYTYAKRFMADNPGILPAASAFLSTSAADDVIVTPAIRQLWATPMFTGTGGLITNLSTTPVPTGTSPDAQWISSFGATAEVACSTVPGNSGTGNAIRMDVSVMANGDGLYLRPINNLATVNVGEYMRVAILAKTSAIAGGAPTQMARNMVYMQSNFSGSTRTISAMLYSAGLPSSAADYPQTDELLTLVTPKHIHAVSVGAVLQPWWQMNVRGANTNRVEVERPALRATSS